MIKAVVFDLDDTLYDEAEFCRSGFTAVAAYLAENNADISQSKAFQLMWTQFSTGNRNKTFDTALEKLGLDSSDEHIDRLLKVYREHEPQLRIPPESLEVLEALHRSYTLGLITDGYLPTQPNKIKALGIEKFFKCIICTEQLGREFWKPSPVPYEKFVEQTGIEHTSCMFVGDNAVKDFVSPNRLGWQTVQIKRAGRIHIKEAPTEEHKANLIIDNIRDIVPLVIK